MSDILEDLCSADPEETPSAAKLTMTRAAAEIESLRKRLLEAEALVADQHDQTSPPDRPRDGRSRGHRIQGDERQTCRRDKYWPLWTRVWIRRRIGKSQSS
jgi:hypothetical protein